MYDRNVAVTGCTIEKTSRYDRFRENNIRMELYRIILALYDEGYRMFSCNLNTYIGLLAADTAIILREADKCPEIHLQPSSPVHAIRQIPTKCIAPYMMT